MNVLSTVVSSLKLSQARTKGTDKAAMLSMKELRVVALDCRDSRARIYRAPYSFSCLILEVSWTVKEWKSGSQSGFRRVRQL